MNILKEIEKLEDFLFQRFKDKIDSGEEITQTELEQAIEEQQGFDGDYMSAKSLIRLLGGDICVSEKISKIYRLVNLNNGISTEIKEVIKKAHK